jgi:hypothetical protein
MTTIIFDSVRVFTYNIPTTQNANAKKKTKVQPSGLLSCFVLSSYCFAFIFVFVLVFFFVFVFCHCLSLSLSLSLVLSCPCLVPSRLVLDPWCVV